MPNPGDIEYAIPLPNGEEKIWYAPPGSTREEAEKRTEVWYREQQMKLGAVQSVGSGIFFGFDDEIGGFAKGLEAYFSGQDYTEAYTRERDILREAKRVFGVEHPVWQIASEIGGGMVTGGALLKGLQALTKAPRAIAALADTASRNPTAQVAVEGALQGVGESEGDTWGEKGADALARAAMGAAAGAGTAKAADVALEVLPFGARSAAQSEMAKDMLLGRRTEDEAAQALEEMNALAPDSNPFMYANVNPEAAHTAASVAAPGKARELTEAVERQRREQGPLTEQVARTVTGTAGTRQEGLDRLIDTRRAEAKGTYKDLEGQPATITPEMRAQVENTTQGQDAAKLALQLINNERGRVGQAPLDMDEAMGTFDFWHYAQQKLRNIGEAGKSKVKEGVDEQIGRQAMDIRGTLMKDLYGQKDWGPQYQEATKLYRERSDLVAALNDSEKFAALPRDKAKKLVGGLKDDNERELVRFGVMNDLIEKAMRTGDEGDMARHFIGNEALRRNLRVVLGDEMFDKLDDAMQKVRSISETNKEVLRGSQTAPRQARAELLAKPVDRFELNPLSPSSWVKNLPNLVGGVQQQRPISGKISDAMVDATLARTPEELRQALAALERQRTAGKTFTGMGSLAAGIPAYQFVTDLDMGFGGDEGSWR